MNVIFYSNMSLSKGYPDNRPRLWLAFELGLGLVLGLGANFPRGQLS